MSIIAAVCKCKNKIGTMKVNAVINFANKVANAESRISINLFFLSTSSETTIPKESERESAIAIINIHHIITDLIQVHWVSHMISHRVVIIPEVTPKLNQISIGFFIWNISEKNKLLR